MTIPRIYRNDRERILANYTFTEVISGTGYLKLYGINTVNISTFDYHLIGQQVFSNDQATKGDTASGTFTKIIDLDFDIEFGFPQTLKGTAIVNIPNGFSTTGNYQTYVIARLTHIDADATETQIGADQQTDTLNYSGEGLPGGDAEVAALRIPITTTKIKRGETIRLTTEMWMRNTGSVTDGVGEIGHDPTGAPTTILSKAEGAQSTALALWLPIKIDL